jgi:lanosterol synthase
MIGYPNYKFYFPVMALGAYSCMYIPKIHGAVKGSF